MFVLKCPKCGNTMKYQPNSKVFAGKRKQCVYCGNSFEASRHIISKCEK